MPRKKSHQLVISNEREKSLLFKILKNLRFLLAVEMTNAAKTTSLDIYKPDIRLTKNSFLGKETLIKGIPV